MIENSFTVTSHLKNYGVFLESDFNFMDRLVSLSQTFWVIDSKVASLYSKLFARVDESRIFLLESHEEQKTVETALTICERLTACDAKRNLTLISVGGGIVQDITGFVASIMYRGINWCFVPTTLLAACDSCIGSKTSLNYKKFKNLLGTFYPPSELHICPLFFPTLSRHDFFSGLGEVIKFNIMSGLNALSQIEADLSLILNRDAAVIAQVVKRSLLFKKSFIEQDEFDRGERIKLNFAHTFGHAIEVLSQYAIPHGTAVAIGMIMANQIAFTRHCIDSDFMSRSERLLLRVIEIDEQQVNRSAADYVAVMRKDKKQVDDSLRCVLITGVHEEGCTLEVVQDLTPSEVEAAVSYFVNRYRKFTDEDQSL